MSKSTIKDNPLNPVDDLSDDEDLFVSTYEAQAETLALDKNKVNSSQFIIDDNSSNENGQESSATKAPTPPPRKQSQNLSSQPIVTELESEMNTINLNDENDEHDGVKDQSMEDTLTTAIQETRKERESSTFKSELIESSIPMTSNETSNLSQHSSLLTSVPINETEASQNSGLQSKTMIEESKPSINTASQITIRVSDPQKMGEGIGSYMVYTVSTKTTLPYFRRKSMSVNRRFSDFLGLHSKLLMKHGQYGRIVPPPPAKSAFGTAKVKMAKDESLHSMDFLAKRRAALERYLQRNAEHPVLCSDPDFREFLELDTELPRSTSTSALSGAGMKRLFSLVGDTVQKMTFRMEESDPSLCNSFEEIKWFESKQQQIEVLDSQLRKLHAAMESLIHYRKELTTSLGLLGKTTALIGHDESNVSLSCALSHLAATHEKVEKIYEAQANNDFIFLSELLRDYISMIGAVKEAFHERVKLFQNLTTLEQNLNRKRESKAKMELSLKNERMPQIDEEIRDFQEKVEKAKDDFEQISETIKQEFERFDTNRIRDFKNNFLKYMESLLETQESLIECWETFLPEAKSISA